MDTISNSWGPSCLYAQVGFQVRAFDLSGNNQAGCRFQPRPGNTRNRVRAAGPGRDHDHAQVIGHPGVGLSGNRGRLLVQRADVLQFLALPERIVQVHGAAAGQHEHVPDAGFGNESHDVIGEFHHGRYGTFPSRRRMR